MKEILILFLDWMNEKTQEAPMSLETDNEDIVLMFLESYKQRTGHELVATTMDEMKKICNQEFESGFKLAHRGLDKINGNPLHSLSEDQLKELKSILKL